MFEDYTRERNKKILTILAVLFVIMGVITFGIGFNKLTQYKNSEYSISSNVNAYVGGDAYNYIINGTYLTAFWTLTAGFAVSASVCFAGVMILDVIPKLQ